MRRIREAIVIRLRANRLARVFAAHVREAQKVKRLALAPAFPLASGRAAATELDQASFLRMKIQAELPESLTESLQTGSCVRFMLETDHEVIRIADHNAIALRMSLRHWSIHRSKT